MWISDQWHLYMHQGCMPVKLGVLPGIFSGGKICCYTNFSIVFEQVLRGGPKVFEGGGVMPHGRKPEVNINILVNTAYHNYTLTSLMSLTSHLPYRGLIAIGL